MLDNLFSNAVKFTEDGGTVTVSISTNGGSATCSVVDTGIGIPSDEQGKIFSRFFRASTATARAIPGTGLGSRSPVRSSNSTAARSRSRAGKARAPS